MDVLCIHIYLIYFCYFFILHVISVGGGEGHFSMMKETESSEWNTCTSSYMYLKSALVSSQKLASSTATEAYGEHYPDTRMMFMNSLRANCHWRQDNSSQSRLMTPLIGSRRAGTQSSAEAHLHRLEGFDLAGYYRLFSYRSLGASSLETIQSLGSSGTKIIPTETSVMKHINKARCTSLGIRISLICSSPEVASGPNERNLLDSSYEVSRSW